MFTVMMNSVTMTSDDSKYPPSQIYSLRWDRSSHVTKQSTHPIASQAPSCFLIRFILILVEDIGQSELKWTKLYIILWSQITNKHERNNTTHVKQVEGKIQIDKSSWFIIHLTRVNIYLTIFPCRNIPREFDSVSLIILIQFSPWASAPQSLS